MTELRLTDDPLVQRNEHGQAYTERICEGCGELAWIRRHRRFCSKSCSRWKGDDAGYKARHDRVDRARGNADRCIHRRAIGCTSTTYNWAQIKGTSGLDVYDYVPMCRSCHTRYDYKGGKAGVPKPSIQGGKNSRAKLNNDIVAECKARVEAGESQSALAREFLVSSASMWKAVTGKTYKNVSAAPAVPDRWRLMDKHAHLRGWNAPPSFRFGRDRFYKRSELEQWLLDIGVPTDEKEGEPVVRQ